MQAPHVMQCRVLEINDTTCCPDSSVLPTLDSYITSVDHVLFQTSAVLLKAALSLYMARDTTTQQFSEPHAQWRQPQWSNIPVVFRPMDWDETPRENRKPLDTEREQLQQKHTHHHNNHHALPLSFWHSNHHQQAEGESLPHVIKKKPTFRDLLRRRSSHSGTSRSNATPEENRQTRTLYPDTAPTPNSFSAPILPLTPDHRASSNPTSPSWLRNTNTASRTNMQYPERQTRSRAYMETFEDQASLAMFAEATSGLRDFSISSARTPSPSTDAATLRPSIVSPISPGIPASQIAAALPPSLGSISSTPPVAAIGRSYSVASPRSSVTSQAPLRSYNPTPPMSHSQNSPHDLPYRHNSYSSGSRPSQADYFVSSTNSQTRQTHVPRIGPSSLFPPPDSSRRASEFAFGNLGSAMTPPQPEDELPNYAQSQAEAHAANRAAAARRAEELQRRWEDSRRTTRVQESAASRGGNGGRGSGRR